MNPTIKADVTNRAGNIQDAAVISSSPGILVIHVSTRQKRPSIFVWMSNGVVLQSENNPEGLGDQIEFEGVPFDARLTFGEPGRYGVYLAMVDLPDHLQSVRIEITRRIDESVETSSRTGTENRDA